MGPPTNPLYDLNCQERDQGKLEDSSFAPAHARESDRYCQPDAHVRRRHWLPQLCFEKSPKDRGICESEKEEIKEESVRINCEPGPEQLFSNEKSKRIVTQDRRVQMSIRPRIRRVWILSSEAHPLPANPAQPRQDLSVSRSAERLPTVTHS